MKKQYLLIFLSLLFMPMLFAQSSVSLAPVTKTYALKNVTIVTKPGQKIEGGTVVIKDGLILNVGKNIRIPANAKVVKADSMYVYAGFIDGLSHIGIPKPDSKSKSNQKPKVPSKATYKQAGIQPHIMVKEVLDPKDKGIEAMRKLGFTAAHVVPRGNMLPGSGAFILLNGITADQMILKDKVSLFSQLSGIRGVYPSTVIGVMSKYRELYRQAEQAKNHERIYNLNPSGIARPSSDRVLKAFYGVIDGKQPVFFRATDMKAIQRVFALQKELRFPLVLADVKQGGYIADKIKSSNATILLALALPKAAKKKAAKSEKDEKAKDAATTKTPEDPEKKLLEKRRDETLKIYETQAATFQAKGIPFGFTTFSAKSKDIKSNLTRMIKNGLKAETALAALTTTPAEQFGVSKIMGTVENGKLANLVVTDKPYFDEKSAVRYVFVEGQLFEYKTKKKSKKKKTGGTDKVKLAGIWTYKVSIPQQGDGKFIFKKDGDDFTGKITSDDDDETLDMGVTVK